MLEFVHPPLKREDEIGERLGDQLSALGMMVIQVLSEAVRSLIGDGEADELGRERRGLVDARAAMRKAGSEDEREHAAEQLRTTLVAFRRRDVDELLPQLGARGADLDELGEHMEIYAT